MAGKFEVLFSRAGEFAKGEVLTEKEITDSGADVQAWLKIGAIKPQGADDPVAEGETSQIVEVGEPVAKDLLKPAEAKEKGLVLNAEKTHWVKPAAD